MSLNSNTYGKIPVRFVLPVTDKNRIGGMEMVAAQILHRLDPERYAPGLVCFNADNGVLSRIDTRRVAVEVIPKKPHGVDPFLIPKLALYFAKTRTRLVQSFNGGSLIYAFPAAKLARVKAVIHADHGRLPVAERSSLTKVRIGMTRRCDHVVVVSDVLKQLMIEQEGIPETKLSMVINGVDLTPFDRKMDAQALRKPFGIGAEDYVVGTVGSLSPVKNQALLIAAAAKVPGIQVLIAGAGPLEETLKTQIAQSGLEKRVHLIGQQGDIPAFLSAVDLFVLPSVTEGTSLALLEAMAARLPVVATDVGGNRAVLEETGHLIPSNDVAALTAQIAWCKAHRTASRKLGEKARQRVEAEYSLERTVAAYEQIFERALGIS